MAFKALVQAINESIRDRDNVLNMNLIHSLKRDIRNDVVDAFVQASPLITKHIDLYESSKSFLDFLFKLCEIRPLECTTEDVPYSSCNNNESLIRELQQKLNKCQRDVEQIKRTSKDVESELKDELQTCQRELQNCQREREKLEEDNLILQKKLDTYQKELETLEESIRTEKLNVLKKTNELSYLKKRYDILNAEFNGLNESLEEAEEKIKCIENKRKLESIENEKKHKQLSNTTTPTDINESHRVTDQIQNILALEKEKKELEREKVQLKNVLKAAADSKLKEYVMSVMANFIYSLQIKFHIKNPFLISDLYDEFQKQSNFNLQWNTVQDIDILNEQAFNSKDLKTFIEYFMRPFIEYLKSKFTNVDYTHYHTWIAGIVQNTPHALTYTNASQQQKDIKLYIETIERESERIQREKEEVAHRQQMLEEQIIYAAENKLKVYVMRIMANFINRLMNEYAIQDPLEIPKLYQEFKAVCKVNLPSINNIHMRILNEPYLPMEMKDYITEIMKDFIEFLSKKFNLSFNLEFRKYNESIEYQNLFELTFNERLLPLPPAGLFVDNLENMNTKESDSESLTVFKSLATVLIPQLNFSQKDWEHNLKNHVLDLNEKYAKQTAYIKDQLFELGDKLGITNLNLDNIVEEITEYLKGIHSFPLQEWYRICGLFHTDDALEIISKIEVLLMQQNEEDKQSPKVELMEDACEKLYLKAPPSSNTNFYTQLCKALKMNESENESTIIYKCQELSKKLYEQDKNIDLEIEKEDYVSEKKEMETQLSQKEKIITELNLKISENEKKISSLEIHSTNDEKIESKIQLMEKRITELDSKNSEFKSKIDEKETLILKLQEQNKILLSNITEKETQLQLKEIEHRRFESEWEENEAILLKRENKIRDFKQELLLKDQEIQDIKNEMNTLVSTLKEKDQDILTMQQEKETFQFSKQQEITDLKSQLEFEKTLINSLTNKFDTEIAEKKKIIVRLGKKIKAFREKESNNQTTVHALNEQNAAKNQTILNLEEEKNQTMAKLFELEQERVHINDVLEKNTAEMLKCKEETINLKHQLQAFKNRTIIQRIKGKYKKTKRGKESTLEKVQKTKRDLRTLNETLGNIPETFTCENEGHSKTLDENMDEISPDTLTNEENCDLKSLNEDMEKNNPETPICAMDSEEEEFQTKGRRRKIERNIISTYAKFPRVLNLHENVVNCEMKMKTLKNLFVLFYEKHFTLLWNLKQPMTDTILKIEIEKKLDLLKTLNSTLRENDILEILLDYVFKDLGIYVKNKYEILYKERNENENLNQLLESCMQKSEEKMNILKTQTF